MLSQQLAGTDGARQTLNRVSLRLGDDVRVQPKRDPRIAVS
jgi:hypothetical protein